MNARCLYGLAIFLSVLLSSGLVSAEPVNAVVGDVSWERAHGSPPVEGESPEVERIRAHLRHVAGELRARSEDELTASQWARRRALLDELEGYARQGVFPRRSVGDGFSGRRPQFIDAGGVHCAVGELMRRSGHGELARRVDAEHEFDYLPDVTTAGVAEWARSHGFSTRELAMIQPAYMLPPSRDRALKQLEGWVHENYEACALVHGAPPRSMRVKVVGSPGKGGEAVLEVDTAGSAFVGCMGDRLSVSFHGRPDWNDPWPDGKFDLAFDVKLPTPNDYVTERLDRFDFENPALGCFPADVSKTPRYVTAKVSADAEGSRLEIVTSPRSKPVEACLTRRVGGAVVVPSGAWGVDVEVRREVVPLAAKRRLQPLLARKVADAMSACSEDHEEYDRISVKVKTRAASASLSVRVRGLAKKHEVCVASELEQWLADELEVEVDGVPTLRVDADTTLTFEARREDLT